MAWMFDRKGLFVIPVQGVEEDALMEVALEAGADDVKSSGDNFEVTCDSEVYSNISEALDEAGIQVRAKEITQIPRTTVALTSNDARKVLRLLELLDDHDDVQNVSANFDVSDEVLAEIEASSE